MQKLRELIKIAQSQRAKAAFVDPAAMGGMPPGGGGMPMDPAMMGGGAPPMDPAMMGGMPPMDPAMMGGAPPPPAGVTADEVRAIIQEAMGSMGGGGAAGGPAGVLKPKIDVNVEIMQIKNILAKIVDAMGIPVPAQDMVATPEKLTAMAQGQNAAGAGAGASSAIAPIEPMQGASPGMAQGKTAAYDTGQPYREPGPNALSGKAAALAEIRRRRNA